MSSGSSTEKDAGIDRSYGHGDSIEALLDIYHNTWCLDCPAEKGEKCQYTAADVPSKNQPWPDGKPKPVVGDPLPYFHHRRRKYRYMLHDERPAHRVTAPEGGESNG